MMKLPKRHAAPWKGGRLAPVGCGGPGRLPVPPPRRRGRVAGAAATTVDYGRSDHDVIWMLLAHTGTASLRTLHSGWQSRTGAHGH
jgi:hypothetical protein